MRFRIYREYGALNSVPVFDALEHGLKSLGYEIVTENEDVAVIWSVLWHGRMLQNQKVYNHCIKTNKPVMIVEVGNLIRNKTWRLSLNHINGLGEFGNDDNLNPNRPAYLGVNLLPYNTNRRSEILIAAQHQRSQQWKGQPAMAQWVQQTVRQLKTLTDRKIVVRPHPRSPFLVKIPGVVMEAPKQIANSYDSFNIDYNYHCVINFNSGPAVQAAISGTPIICDQSSLAAPIANSIENIENLQLVNREDWFLKLCHTEWTVEEIGFGIPLARLISKIS